MLTKALRTAQKRQKVTHDADMRLEGLVMESERDRLQRYSDCDCLMQVKQNVDVYVYLDRIFSNDHRKKETVKKELIQLGVCIHQSMWRKCFQAQRLHILSTDFVSLLD